ncbi:MAG: GNAT family N-acetyltransferase [Rhodobacter sp.]|nr:GNAT family N-acetyltransferase [Rhodobacter sp.]
MAASQPDFQLKLAGSTDELQAAQRLRYQVFVDELGAAGPEIDHVARLEKDRYDPFFDHLLLLDRNRTLDEQVIGVYRLMRPEQADRLGSYYSESEYDLSVLKSSGRRLLELGRSCVHPAYRGGTAMYELWGGLSDYITRHEIEILFGVASFPGTDIDRLAQPLSLLHHRHLAPPDLRVTARVPGAQRMDLMPEDAIDRRGAMVATPALIKAYLRLGGFVGQGAWVDRAFNTTDVCLVMDTARMNTRQRNIYTRPRG